jgi:hypothetical protein
MSASRAVGCRLLPMIEATTPSTSSTAPTWAWTRQTSTLASIAISVSLPLYPRAAW